MGKANKAGKVRVETGEEEGCGKVCEENEGF